MSRIEQLLRKVMDNTYIFAHPATLIAERQRSRSMACCLNRYTEIIKTHFKEAIIDTITSYHFRFRAHESLPKLDMKLIKKYSK